MQPITIWLETPTPRARYGATQLFGAMLGWELRWANDIHELRPADGPCLVYGQRAVEGAFHLLPHGWLASASRDALEPEVAVVGGAPVLFPVAGGRLPFDPIAGAFYSLARYEEWKWLPLDEHDRPLTSAMHAFRHGYLHRPVVDEWALMVARVWHELDARVPAPARAYRQVFTIDLDNGFKYLGRETWRSLGAWGRDIGQGRWHDVVERTKVLRGAAVDPFVLDDEMLELISMAATRRIAFILAAERGQRDHAVPVDHEKYRSYLKHLAKHLEMGLHPSYASSTTEGRTRTERDRLSAAIGQPIELSRQHFLRTALPGTYREAIALGLREEHSMGCHDQLGFRAGTCTPYAWYDLEREEQTELVIHPFAVMDNTLRDKLRLSPEEAVERAAAIASAVRKVDGVFTGLWHESFLAATGASASWRAAILRIIDAARA